MVVTKKENGIEQVKRERDGLDSPGVFMSDALGGFRGRFLFSFTPWLQPGVDAPPGIGTRLNGLRSARSLEPPG